MSAVGKFVHAFDSFSLCVEKAKRCGGKWVVEFAAKKNFVFFSYSR